MNRLRQAFARPREAFGAVFANPNLRRIQLAGGASVIGNWSYATALAVYAYLAGGATAVGVLGVVRMLPAALGAPFMASLGDRFARERVMVVADLVQAAAMVAIAACIVADLHEGVVFALAGLSGLVATAFRPAQAALLPTLARTPEELTAANVASSTIVSLGSFAGPALAGLLLALTDVEWVVLFNAATFVWSAVLVARIRSGDAAARAARKAGAHSGALAGFVAISDERRIRHLVTLFSAQTLIDGMRPVLIVTAAFTILELDESGVGFLNSALGVGGLAGAAVALTLGRKLGTNFAVGLALWGLGIALIGVVPELAAALFFLAIVGVGNTIVDVSGFTLLQRAAPDEVLARVFGALESLLLGTTMLGALLAPLLIEWIGIRGALVAAGGLLPVLAALSVRQLRAFDAEVPEDVRRRALVQAVPMLAPLPQPALERLAAALVPLRVSAGDDVIRQGDSGDRFYVIAAGELEVAVDGRPGTPLAAGDFFGEIALLRDVPRTATVTARTDAELFALDRDDFIGAVTGHAASAEAADAVVSARLGATPRPNLNL